MIATFAATPARGAKIAVMGDRGTLIQIRSGISATHLQGALDAGGADVTAQSSGRILMLWEGRPSASSAATLNRCLPP